MYINQNKNSNINLLVILCDFFFLKNNNMKYYLRFFYRASLLSSPMFLSENSVIIYKADTEIWNEKNTKNLVL